MDFSQGVCYFLAMGKYFVLKIMVMVLSLLFVVYAMRELQHPTGTLRANNSPISILFSKDNR